MVIGLHTQLVQGNLTFLRQARELLQQLDDSQYAHCEISTGRGRVGAHLRHVVDHYSSLLNGLHAGCVDYDARERNGSLETSRAAMTEALTGIEAALRELATRTEEVGLDVWIDSGEPAARTRSRSTLARELQFVCSHTVHHYAVIALLLRERGHPVDADFGVAPSTRKHEAEQAACAR